MSYHVWLFWFSKEITNLDISCPMKRPFLSFCMFFVCLATNCCFLLISYLACIHCSVHTSTANQLALFKMCLVAFYIFVIQLMLSAGNPTCPSQVSSENQYISGIYHFIVKTLGCGGTIRTIWSELAKTCRIMCMAFKMKGMGNLLHQQWRIYSFWHFRVEQSFLYKRTFLVIVEYHISSQTAVYLAMNVTACVNVYSRLLQGMI